MTSLRQIEANRRNASKSTGPVTPEGKNRSRRNALVHGLAGDGVVLPDPDAALVAERLRTWRVGYDLTTPEDEWAFHELVVNATRVDVCRARESALRAHEAARASILWAEDRRADAEDLAAGLARRPGRTSARLETTAAGCRWLIARWGDLARPGADDQAEARAALAADLLGLPADARDPAPWAAFGFATPVALAESEAARLSRRLADGLDDLDAAERAMAEAGTPARHGPEVLRLRRYESDCLRRYERARARLTRRTPDALAPPPPPIPVEPPPPPAPPPPPLPAPESKPDAAAAVAADRSGNGRWLTYERSLYHTFMAEVQAALKAEDEAQAAAPVAASSPKTLATPPTPPLPRLNRKARRTARRLAG